MNPDLVMAALVPLMLTLIGLGVFGGARRSGSKPLPATRVALATVLALVAWLGFAAFLAERGVLSNWSALPPRWPLLPLSAFLATTLIMRSTAAAPLLSSVPAAWLIATQSFRIGVELALHALHTAGRAPIQVTFEGRNFDILVGISAAVVAWLVASKKLGPKGAIVWNVLGLLVLANTVGTVATSTPGPLHLDWPGAPLTAIVEWPIVWLPAFLMPLAVFLHIASLRQNLRALRPARSGQTP